jgi:peptidoglycan hydrolase-like protein with peptidoglycan-binding domain
MALIDDGSIYGQAKLRVIPGGADAAAAPAQLPPAHTPGDPTVLAVQRALAARGMFNGTAHGVLDVSTQEAIKTYQRGAGIPVTGAITELLVRDLRAQIAPVPQGYGAGGRGPPPNRPQMVLADGQIPPAAPSPFKLPGTLLAFAAAGTAIMYWLTKRSKRLAMADRYEDVASPDDDFDNDDEDDEGEQVALPPESED